MNSKVLITISALSVLAISCQSLEIVPLVSIKFDNPLVKVDSCGNMEISDSGKVWYPVSYDTDCRSWFDTLKIYNGETLLVPKRKIRDKTYEAYIAQDWNRTLLERHDIQDSTTPPDNYESKYYVELIYPPLKRINIRRPASFTISNFRTMQLFNNELPDTLISNVDMQYHVDSLFIIKTKNINEYIIIPDCHWNMEDVIDYVQIRLYDDSMGLKDSGHRFCGKTVYIPDDSNVMNDWLTVYVKDENDPLVYTGYLKSIPR